MSVSRKSMDDQALGLSDSNSFAGNNGLGDAVDFMNVVTSASEKSVKELVTTEKKTFTPSPPPNPFQDPVGAIKTVGHALSDGIE